MYQTQSDFNLNISDRCCYKLKKEPMKKFEKLSNRKISITGMLREEGGIRSKINCIVTDTKTGNMKRFHPMAVCTKDFENWYIKRNNIELCELYYPPYNFTRTGCKGCPFALNLQAELDLMSMYMPEEKKQCELIWGKVYKEYRRIHYRLEKTPSLFD